MRVRRMMVSALSILLVAAGAVAAAPADPPTPPIGHVQVEGNVVSVQPMVEFDRARLTVSGLAEGIVLQRTVEEAGPFNVTLADDGGEPLVDGVYHWEFLMFRDAVRDDEGRVVEGFPPLALRGDFVIAGGAVQATGSEPGSDAEVARSAAVEGDIHHDGSVTATGNGCFGSLECSSSYSPLEDLEVIDSLPILAFLDDSTLADRTFRWEIEADGGSFRVEDTDNSNTEVLEIEKGAPAASLYIDSTGEIGIGTSAPIEAMHIVAAKSVIRVENTTSGTTWDLGDPGAGDFDFEIAANGSGGPTGTVFTITDDDGYVGVNENAPEAPLHVSGDGSIDTIFFLENQAPPGFRFRNAVSAATWFFKMNQFDTFVISREGTGGDELRIKENGELIVGPSGTQNMVLDPTGDLEIAGTLTQGSSRHIKAAIDRVDGREVLDRVGDLPVSTWSYRNDDSGARHLGPMAEDFAATFGLGDDDEHLAPSDLAGVALAAIQGLDSVVEEEMARRDEEIARLREANAALEERLAALEARLGDLSPDPR